MGEDNEPAPPQGLRVLELEFGGQTLRVFSHPIDELRLDETKLTSAEADVAALAIEGLSNAEIAEARCVAVRTVANQMAAILAKLELGSRRELAVRYVRNDLEEPR